LLLIQTHRGWFTITGQLGKSSFTKPLKLMVDTLMQLLTRYLIARPILTFNRYSLGYISLKKPHLKFHSDELDALGVMPPSTELGLS